MTKILLFISTIVFALNASALIYGSDDRKEIFESARAQKLVRATATMVATSYLLPQADGYLNLDFAPATASYGANLCKEERFSSEPSGWLNCTGFLVAPDILVTAGHCEIFSHQGSQGLIEQDQPPSSMCPNFAWMFDFAQTSNGNLVKTTGVKKENIYYCASVLYAEALGDYQDPATGVFGIPAGGEHGRDFAIVKLDRPVVGREPLKLSKLVPSFSERLATVGYPSALPAKYAEGMALSGNYKNYFVTDLDIAEGTSGSPVFNSKDEVEGIVVRGFPYEDYQYLEDRKCNKSIVCEQIGQGSCVGDLPNEVLGTHVQKASAIIEKLKELGLAQ